MQSHKCSTVIIDNSRVRYIQGKSQVSGDSWVINFNRAKVFKILIADLFTGFSRKVFACVLPEYFHFLWRPPTTSVVDAAAFNDGNVPYKFGSIIQRKKSYSTFNSDGKNKIKILLLLLYTSSFFLSQKGPKVFYFQRRAENICQKSLIQAADRCLTRYFFTQIILWQSQYKVSDWRNKELFSEFQLDWDVKFNSENVPRVRMMHQ